MPRELAVHPTTRRPSREVAGLEARKAALRSVDAALSRRGGLEDVERETFAALDDRDRAFARTLTLALLRWRGPIDRALATRLERAPPEPVMALLRLGAAQLLVLDTPAHAAVATTVTLASESKATRPFAKLVNAVLRGLDRERPHPTVDDFAPSWLMARWRAAYGEDAARALAGRIAEEPPTDLSLRDPADAIAVAEALGGEVLPGPTVRTPRRGDVAQWPGFAEGRWWIQDAAAALPARVLDPRPGEDVLDLCAAPGGKTLQLAAAGARTTALDSSVSRMERVKANLDRTGLGAEIVVADAFTWNDGRRFDGVLLDAPCSATGTFRRHPDVLLNCRPADIASMAQTQARLLDAAVSCIRPGGRLVYCVCSLEPEEGEAQIAPFLRRHPDMRLDPISAGEGAAPGAAYGPNGTLRLLPGFESPTGGVDGFFVARFRRQD